MIYYLFLDFETEGLDIPNDRAIEVGWRIMGEDLETCYGYGSRLIHQTGELRLNSFVREMHQKSGLLDDWNDARQSMKFQWEIEQEICFDLDILAESDNEVVVKLAGSGVDFDRRIIRATMPDLEARLHYQMMDTSVVRRFLRDLCGVDEDSIDIRPPEALVEHRAYDDVLAAIDELRAYRDYVQFVPVMKDIVAQRSAT